MGYQLAVYLDKPSTRLQIILAALAADNNWKLCADGALLSKHKVTVRYRLAYIENRRKYKGVTVKISHHVIASLSLNRLKSAGEQNANSTTP